MGMAKSIAFLTSFPNANSNIADILRNSKESVYDSFYMWFGAWTRICEIRSVSYSALEELTRIHAICSVSCLARGVHKNMCIASVSCLAVEELTRMICAFLLYPIWNLNNSQQLQFLIKRMWVLKETGRSCYKNQGLQRRRIHDPMKSFGKCFCSSILHELRTTYGLYLEHRWL